MPGAMAFTCEAGIMEVSEPLSEPLSTIALNSTSVSTRLLARCVRAIHVPKRCLLGLPVGSITHSLLCVCGARRQVHFGYARRHRGCVAVASRLPLVRAMRRGQASLRGRADAHTYELHGGLASGGHGGALAAHVVVAEGGVHKVARTRRDWRCYCPRVRVQLESRFC